MKEFYEDFFDEPPTNDLSEDNFSPKVQIKWQLNDAAMVYAGVSEGFRSGGVNSNARSIDDPDVTGPDDSRLAIPVGYTSETIRAYEVGFKSNPTNILQINGSVYFNQWEDIHLLDVSSDGLWPFTVNASDAEVKGAELELVAIPLDGLLLSFSGSYTDAELKADVLNGVGVPIATKGNEIPFVPKFSLNATANYTFPLVGAYDGLIWASYTHRSKTYSDIANTELARNGNYDLLNFRLGMESETWGIFLFVDNLSDSEDTILRRDPRGSVPPLLLSNYVRPRTIGIEVGINF